MPGAAAIVARLVGRLVAGYVRLVAATSQIRADVDRGVRHDAAVLAFWHEYNLAVAVVAFRLRRGARHVSFSTRGFRGMVVSSMLDALGAESVPLPAAGESAEAARLSLAVGRLGREGATLIVTPDGPFGPYRRAKPGALIAARESALPIRPWAIAVRPSLRLGRRWDRHVVPLPFSRLRIVEGAALLVREGERLRPRLAELQAELDRVAERADAVERRR